jgi:hypothetical protein
MERSARNRLFLLFFLVPALLPAVSDEQQKAHKILNKINAMATDPAGKRAVSLAMSQHLSVARAELAQRRRAMNLNYGELFVAYELVKSGKKIDDIAAKVKMGKTVWQTADEEHADWKQIVSEAKKVSAKVDNNLLAHFTNRKSEVEKDHADGYDPLRDSVKADSEVTQHEIDEAQQRYMFLHDHAGVVSATGIDTATEKAAGTFLPDPRKAENRPGAESVGSPPPH